MYGVQAGSGIEANAWMQAAARPGAGTGVIAAAAAAADVDLGAHLGELVQGGRLLGFLDQTGDAIALAQGDSAFAAELDPLLVQIREALVELPTGNLSRLELDAVDATLAALDDHLGSAGTPPDGGAEVPGGGLEAHEDAGSHLIERHVGKSEQQLLERLQRENISASSSFRDLPAAEHFVAETIAENQDKVDAWLDGKGGRRLVLDAAFDSSTGISVRRGDTQAEDVFSVKLVLERSDALGIGYRIVTGYPTTP